VKLATGRHADPFTVLGPHREDHLLFIRAFCPRADSVNVISVADGTLLASMSRVHDEGVFETEINTAKTASITALHYQLQLSSNGHTWTIEDPYRFSPVLGELDEHLIAEGSHQSLWQVLGAHLITHERVEGTHFAVWAPNARRVSIVGDFNHWDGRCHCMRPRGTTGVWEIFLPGIVEGEAYKFELLDQKGTLLPQKADPFGFGAEHPPKTASIVRRLNACEWSDQIWMTQREARQRVNQPISIYEVHSGSWRKITDEGDRPLSYVELAVQLVTYAKTLGFTHIELMPVSEFPFDGSWGYQPVGLFAPTIRHGTPDEFRAFVDACHAQDMGLILDWVPGHFPEDSHGLGRFDGTSLYEHADRREGFHPDWKTLVFNYGRREVSNYLISNALYWFSEFHIDGIRVDAVASMLYRDYSRKEGEWITNKHGGRENLEAIAFLQRVNEISYASHPGIMTMAEESTAFPAVSGMTSAGGLGFGFKWNMGWMNDSLAYMSEDPLNRKYHHHKITQSLHYAFSENFVLPLSHDEVVHGKGSLLARMPGTREEQFANLRAYFGFMWGHPGKKLLFMGGEFAQADEWSHQHELPWHLLDHPEHQGVQNLVQDLNAMYRSTPALYQRDSQSSGFAWIEENASDESILVWLRLGDDDVPPVLVIANFTPVERLQRRVGVPRAGCWQEILNTDATHYGGGGRGNMGGAESEPVAASGRAQSLVLTLPPLATLFFRYAG